jgi:hypothetical protein
MSFFLVVVAALLGTTLADLPTPELQKQIEKASEAQKDQAASSSISREIDLAPEANLTAGTGDIDTNGPCNEDIPIFCPDVKPGYAHLAECLNNQMLDDEEGSSEFTAMISKECKQDLLNFKIALSENINMDVETAAACKADAKRLCGFTKMLNFPGKVIACLREKKSQLQGKCEKRITLAQLQAAEDYRLDANVYDACKADAENICKDVKPGSGRMNGCLRDNRAKVCLWPQCISETSNSRHSVLCTLYWLYQGVLHRDRGE